MNTLCPILEVENLSKSFRVYRRERHRFMAWLGINRHPPEENWVLSDVSFSLAPGESVGIVGDNGAGKSTLLKLITGTLRPECGRITARGRISAILELGMGFNAEFSGEKNAFHAAGLLGFSRSRLREVLPEIRAFSELGDYFEQPVRTYSSGMQMRLAFAVATADRPDIFIVDEALSVGESYFQHKCMQRIRAYREAGTTLLFVSHSPDAVRILCGRGLLLDAGRLAMDADAASVIDYYRAATVKKCEMNDPGDCGSVIGEEASHVPGRLVKTVLSRDTVEEMSADLFFAGESVRSGDELTIRVMARFSRDYPDPHAGFGLRNRLGVIIYESNTFLLGCPSRPVRAGETLTAQFTFRCELFPGTYELMIGLANGGYGECSFEQSLFFDQSYLIFEVTPGESPGWGGLCNMRPQAVLA